MKHVTSTKVTQSRREFLRTAGLVSAAFCGLRHVFGNGNALALDRSEPQMPFGPLQADPYGVLNLPAGFRYHVFSKLGERMDDGLLVPGMHDGMAAFAGPNGRTILVRNHELADGPARQGAFGWTLELFDRVPRDRVYDAGHGRAPGLGGTTTLVYDTQAHRLERHFLSLAGTHNNCAGGPTPWGTWISCEETQQQAGDAYEQDHGYNFEVPASAQIGLVEPKPLKGMGRFSHEAVAVDATTGIVYQTEDVEDGLIYRYIPHRRGDLPAGGRLQALAVRDQPSMDTRNWVDEAGKRVGPRITQGTVFEVAWLDLDQIDSPDNDLRHRGFAAGAARFARGEGMWYDNRSVFFACTNGGQNRKGQIWRYRPSRFEGELGGTSQKSEQHEPGRLELFIEPNDRTLVENCDNVTVAPWGDLVLCEDGPDEQFLVGVRPDGTTYRLAKNVANGSEFAGATFSPDGSTLFLNVQSLGVTMAVTGPWPAASAS